MLRSTSSTFAPSRAKRRAAARPLPMVSPGVCPAPTTIPTLSVSLIVSSTESSNHAGPPYFILILFSLRTLLSSVHRCLAPLARHGQAEVRIRAIRAKGIHAVTDDMIRSQEHGRGDPYTEGLGGLEVDDQLKGRGLLDRQVPGLHALQDTVHVVSRSPVAVGSP